MSETPRSAEVIDLATYRRAARAPEQAAPSPEIIRAHEARAVLYPQHEPPPAA